MGKKPFRLYVDINTLALIILWVILVDTKQQSKSWCFSVSLIRNLLKLMGALNQAL